MDLAKKQQLLARLFTDTVMRKRFFADPERVSQEFGLSVNGARQLAPLSREQVTVFARSLRRKRANEVRKLLPLTHLVLGERFDKFFQEYADSHVPSGLRKHHKDALAFAAMLNKRANTDNIEPIWLADLIRYEASWVRTTNSNFWCGVSWFRYPVGKLARSLAAGYAVPAIQRRFSIGLWFRLSGRGQLHHVIL